MVVGNYIAMASNIEVFKKLPEMKKGVTLSPSDAKLFSASDVVAVIKLGGVMRSSAKKHCKKSVEVRKLLNIRRSSRC